MYSPIHSVDGGRGRSTATLTTLCRTTAPATAVASKTSDCQSRPLTTRTATIRTSAGTMTAVDASQVTDFMASVSHAVRTATIHCFARGSNRAISSCPTTSWVSPANAKAASAPPVRVNVSQNPCGVVVSRRRPTHATSFGNRMHTQVGSGIAASRSPRAHDD